MHFNYEEALGHVKVIKREIVFADTTLHAAEKSIEELEHQLEEAKKQEKKRCLEQRGE